MRRSLFTLVLATLVFITGCEVNPATGRRQLMLVNPGQLDAMGAEAAPMLVQEYGGEVPQTELRQPAGAARRAGVR
jgi:predicted Zn-dependent protease